MKIIVLGGHVQALGIVRIFGKIGYKVYVADTTKRNIARHSKFCAGFIFNSGIRWDAFLKSLNEGFDNSVIFPTNDEQVQLLSKNKSSLSDRFIPAVPDWSVVEKCYYKTNTYKIAESIGVEIPLTLFPKSINDLELLAKEIRYPVIIKPSIMHLFYKAFRKKVFLCNNKEELLVNYSKTIKILPWDQIIIQEIIQGDSFNNYSAGVLFDNGEALISLTARRKRQHPLFFGNATTYAETVNIPEIHDNAVKLLKEINYSGICEVEYKFDNLSGKYKFLEINPRTWKWHYISEIADTPFLEGLLDLLQGKDVPISTGYKKSAWRHMVTDLPVVFQLLFKKMLRNGDSRPVIEAVWSMNDPKPMIMELIYLPFLIKTR